MNWEAAGWWILRLNLPGKTACHLTEQQRTLGADPILKQISSAQKTIKAQNEWLETYIKVYTIFKKSFLTYTYVMVPQRLAQDSTNDDQTKGERTWKVSELIQTK